MANQHRPYALRRDVNRELQPAKYSRKQTIPAPFLHDAGMVHCEQNRQLCCKLKLNRETDTLIEFHARQRQEVHCLRKTTLVEHHLEGDQLINNETMQLLLVHPHILVEGFLQFSTCDETKVFFRVEAQDFPCKSPIGDACSVKG